MTALPQAVQKKPMSFLLGLGVYNIGLNLVWIAYNSILLPIMVQNATTEATKGIWQGVISAVSIFAGITVSVLAGVISDHSNSRFGRRTPLLVSGMVFTVVFMVVTAILPQVLPFVFLFYFFLQVFGNVTSGAYLPLLADIVPETQRGTASGFQGMFTIVGAAIGFIVVTSLVSAKMLPVALIVMSVVFFLTTMFTAGVIRKVDRPISGIEPLKLGKAIAEMFRVRTRVPGFFWFVFANFLMYMGVSSFASYGIFYLQTVIQMEDPVAAMGIAGLVGMVVNIGAAVAAGFVADRMKKRTLVIIAGVLSGIFSLFFPYMRSFVGFIAVSVFYGAANGIIYSVNQALVSLLVPAEESGKFMSYNNLSIGAANALAPLIFGAIINLQGAPTVFSFTIFFFVAAVFYFASSVLIYFRVPNR